MTVPDMNAQQAKKWAMTGLGLAAGLSLAACATPGAETADEAVAPLSPRITALIAANRGYPDWRNFPRQGTPPPSAVEVAGRVAALDTASSEAAAQVAAIDWTLEDPEGFARRTAEDIAARPIAPATLQTREEVEAFAQGLRDRGRAPPPIPRR